MEVAPLRRRSELPAPATDMTAISWNEALVCGHADVVGTSKGQAAEDAATVYVVAARRARQMVAARRNVRWRVAAPPDPAFITDAGALRRAAAVAATVVKIRAVAAGANGRDGASAVGIAGGPLRTVAVVDALGQAGPLLPYAHQVVRTGNRGRADALALLVTGTGRAQRGFVDARCLLAGISRTGELAAAVGFGFRLPAARGAQPAAGIFLTRLGLVPRLALGAAQGLAVGADSIRADSGERAQDGDAERREDAPSWLETCIGKGLRQTVKAIVVHWIPSRCGFATA